MLWNYCINLIVYFIDCGPAEISLFCFPVYCKARSDITEVHFLPFNPTDKRTALTYIDKAGKMHRVSKGAPEQVWRISVLEPKFLTTLPYTIKLQVIFLMDLLDS